LGGIDMEDFLKKYSILIVIVCCVGSLIPRFLFSIESNIHLVFTFTYLSLPITLICFYLYFYKLPTFRKKMGKLKGIISIIFISFILSLMSANYIYLVNAYIGNQKEFLIEGEVVKLDSGTLRLGAFSALLYFSKYHVYVKDLKSNKVRKLEVSKEHFMSLNKNQLYSETWKKGSLDLVYKKIN
jgi:hypothetical protein